MDTQIRLMLPDIKVGDLVQIISLPDEVFPGVAPKMETMVGFTFKITKQYERLYGIKGYLWERRNLRKIDGPTEDL